MSYVLAALGGYLAGSIPTGYWLVRLFRGIDIRRVGSKSIGATNVWRVLGWKVGVPTIALDVAKGAVPAFIAAWLVDDVAGAVAGGAAMLGHARPLFLKFERGGKAVATTTGVLFGLAPLLALIAVGVWLLAFLVTRYVSAASITGAATVPLLAFAIDESWSVKILCIAGSAAVVFLHRENLRRLFARREPRVELAGMFRR